MHFPDARSLTKKLFSSGKFWTVSATAEEGKLSIGKENWCPKVLTATSTVHGVFLDYDCTSNKDVFKEVS